MEEDADATIVARLDNADGPDLAMAHEPEQLSGNGSSEGHNFLRRDALSAEGTCTFSTHDIYPVSTHDSYCIIHDTYLTTQS